MPGTRTLTKIWRTDAVGKRARGGTQTVQPKRAGWTQWRSGMAIIRRMMGSVVNDHGRKARFEEALHAFATDISGSLSPEAIESALVRLAHRVSDGAGVELIRATGERAVFNEGGDAEGPTIDERGNDADVEEFRMRYGSANHGVLRLRFRDGRMLRDERDAIGRRLNLACTLAACALENARLQSEWIWDPTDEEPRVPTMRQSEIVRDATFLNAVLPFALEQSRRHVEPASLICARVENLPAIRDLLGPAIAEDVVWDLGQQVGSMIRSSDLVARLEDGRIVALLMRARGEDALRVASAIRKQIAEAGLGSPGLPGTTVSFSVAEFPAVAHDAAGLLDAADEAMSAACAAGFREPVLAGRRPQHGPPRPHTQTHAGAIDRSPELTACA